MVFIDGRNVLQPHTVWNISIHTYPNIQIHLSKFALLHNYWYCDFEYLRIYSGNKSSIYCGNRLPWMHDALDTTVKIVFVTHRYGQKNYQLELQYYGAYVPPSNKQFFILTSPSSVINIHPLMIKQNAFQSFHFISNGRINIVQLQAINKCSKDQLICYDGPGTKSPILQSTYNQSEWQYQSNTFHMVCTYSKADTFCTKVTYLHYKATPAAEYHLRDLRDVFANPVHLSESNSRGTSKYMYSQFSRLPPHMVLELIIENMDNPYMLYEGMSCIYGGLYIFQTLSDQRH